MLKKSTSIITAACCRQAKKLSKFSIGLLILVFVALGLYANFEASRSVSAAQSIPYMVNFQGRLTDTTGVAMPDGQYNVKFRLYDAASGGTVLWSEDRTMTTTDTRITLTNGLFSVQLGTVSALSPTLFNSSSPRYLEVELPTPASAACATNGCAVFTEGPMTPRNVLSSAAYAFNSDTLDGIDGSRYARNDTANTFTGGDQLISADSTTALRVQNTLGIDVLTVDTTNSKLVVRGNAGADTATLGPELITITDFTNAIWTTTGWTAATTSATHVSGTTTALSTTQISVVTGETYQISFTVTGASGINAGVAPNIGGVNGNVATYGNVGQIVYLVTATSTGTLQFRPDSSYVGAISAVSVKQVTFATAALQINRSNNTVALEVRAGSSSNTFIGVEVGKANTTGTGNIGLQGLRSNTTGSENIGIGITSLRHNTTGTVNVAIGSYALQNNVNASGSVAIGSQALQNSVIYGGNVAIGYRAAMSTINGSNLTAVGFYALQANTSGSSNTAMGDRSLYSNTAGGNLAAFGAYSLYSNTTGNQNTAFGDKSLYGNTSGYQNVAVGSTAMYGNTTGVINTAVGDSAMYNTTTGYQNTALGGSALFNNTTGVNNTAVGSRALYRNLTGYNNAGLGNLAGERDGNFLQPTDLIYSTALGSEAVVQSSNSMVLGRISMQTKVGIGTTLPQNVLSVSPVQHSTGTASQSGTTITGSGTTFTSAMVGNQFVFANGATATITAFSSTTSLVASVSQTVSSQSYRIHYQGLQVDGTGRIGMGTSAPTAQLHVLGDTVMQARIDSSSAVQFQNAVGSNLLVADTTANTANLIPNSGFESGRAGWAAKGTAALTNSTAQQYFGTQSLGVITTDFANDGAKYPITLLASTQYSVSFVAKSSVNFSGFAFGYSPDGVEETSLISTANSVQVTWLRYTYTFTTPATISGTPYLFFKQTDPLGRSIYIDAVQLIGPGSSGSYNEARISIGGDRSTATALGINTTSPQAALHVQQALGQTGALIKGNGDSSLFAPYLFAVQTGAGENRIYYQESTNSTVIQGGHGFWDTPALQVNALATNVSALRVQGVSGQTSDILQVRDGAGTTLAAFTSNGSLIVSGAATESRIAGKLIIGSTAGSPADTPLTIHASTAWASGWSKSIRINGSAGGASCGTLGCNAIEFNGGNALVWGQGVNGAGDMNLFTANAEGSTAAITTRLTVSNSTTALTVGGTVKGNLVVNGTSATCTLGNGTGATSCTSDARLKTNITTYEGSLGKIMQLRPTSFNWINNSYDPDTKIGLIAQEVDQVFPEFVTEVSAGMLGIDYAALVTPLIGAVQEQQNQINTLKSTDLQGSSLSISGDSSLQGGLVIGKDLRVRGAAMIASLIVDGNATFQGNLAVKGLFTVADIVVNGHIITGGSVPVVTTAAGACTGLVASVVGNDTAGTLKLSVPAGCATKGALATITFAKAYTDTPVIVATPVTSEGASLQSYITQTATSFTLHNSTATMMGGEHSFNYIVIQ
jgi:hypothetical protein